MVLSPGAWGIDGVTNLDGPLIATVIFPPLMVMYPSLDPKPRAVTPTSVNTARQSTTRASGEFFAICLLRFLTTQIGLSLNPGIWVRGHCTVRLLPQSLIPLDPLPWCRFKRPCRPGRSEPLQPGSSPRG